LASVTRSRNCASVQRLPTPLSLLDSLPCARSVGVRSKGALWQRRPGRLIGSSRMRLPVVAKGVQHRRRRHRDGVVAHAAPEATRGHDDGLDPGHVGVAHQRVGVEVALPDAAVLCRALLEQRGRQAADEAALDLGLDLLRVHGLAGVCGGDGAVDVEPAVGADR